MFIKSYNPIYKILMWLLILLGIYDAYNNITCLISDSLNLIRAGFPYNLYQNELEIFMLYD